MGLRPGETHLEYKKRVIEPISKSFCAAKWVNATIWLASGQTASCHHPPSAQIDVREIATNPRALHNTKVKKEARAQMLKGERPDECEYCWKIEDLGREHVSDRVFKTFIYPDEEIQAIAGRNPFADSHLRTLEVAFDRICQFACMYCNPSFSSTWVKDIKSQGPYRDLPTDKREHYVHTHESADPFGENNPYIEAFWKWWPELRETLQELRITGGEPLMSPHFWRVLEHFKQDGNSRMRLAFNSNLGARDEVIDKLIEQARAVRHLEIYTSGEAFGAAGEYVRDGLNWNQWTGNIEKLMDSGVVKRLHVMMTINGLCLFSFPEFLDQMYEWKKRWGFESPTLSTNILRFPTFQSPLVLPPDLRREARQRIIRWYEKVENDKLVLNFEKDSIARLIDYLGEVEVPTKTAEPRDRLEKDLKRFLVQYDQRRGKDVRSVLPSQALDWLDSVEA